jgi:hypothetical protein
MSNNKVSIVQSEATEISKDMRNLYREFKAGTVEREAADTLANIAGKNLKALSIVLADQMRLDGQIAYENKVKLVSEQ